MWGSLIDTHKTLKNKINDKITEKKPVKFFFIPLSCTTDGNKKELKF